MIRTLSRSSTTISLLPMPCPYFLIILIRRNWRHHVSSIPTNWNIKSIIMNCTILRKTTVQRLLAIKISTSWINTFITFWSRISLSIRSTTSKFIIQPRKFPSQKLNSTINLCRWLVVVNYSQKSFCTKIDRRNLIKKKIFAPVACLLKISSKCFLMWNSSTWKIANLFRMKRNTITCDIKTYLYFIKKKNSISPFIWFVHHITIWRNASTKSAF